MNQVKRSLQTWGPFGTLALSWTNAFLKEDEYLVLRLILERGKLNIEVEELQKFNVIRKEALINSLLNLQNSGILIVSTSNIPVKKTQFYHFINQARNITHCIVNPNICDHLKLMLENQIIPLAKKYEMNLNEEINQIDKLICESCNQDYLITDLHLGNQKECSNMSCRIKKLVPLVVNTQKKKRVDGLKDVIRVIQEEILKCEDEEFPKIEQFQFEDTVEQKKENSLCIYTIIFNKKLKGDEVEKNPDLKMIRTFIVSQRKKRFIETLNQKTDRYLEMKINKIKQKNVMMN